jgi:hypothetical protein
VFIGEQWLQPDACQEAAALTDFAAADIGASSLGTDRHF